MTVTLDLIQIFVIIYACSVNFIMIVFSDWQSKYGWDLFWTVAIFITTNVMIFLAYNHDLI